jgi:hypothetical protein
MGLIVWTLGVGVHREQGPNIMGPIMSTSGLDISKLERKREARGSGGAFGSI